ncbi:MAG: DUF2752 domain-containing protein [Aquaticitalea sp.]
MSSPEDYMLPCLNKKLFGIECMGCGLQRSVLLVFQGHFKAAFIMYPAIYSLFLLALFLIFNTFVKFKFDHSLKMGLIILNVAIVVISYFIKMNV